MAKGSPKAKISKVATGKTAAGVGGAAASGSQGPAPKPGIKTEASSNENENPSSQQGNPPMGYRRGRRYQQKTDPNFDQLALAALLGEMKTAGFKIELPTEEEKVTGDPAVPAEVKNCSDSDDRDRAVDSDDDSNFEDSAGDQEGGGTTFGDTAKAKPPEEVKEEEEDLVFAVLGPIRKWTYVKKGKRTVAVPPAPTIVKANPIPSSSYAGFPAAIPSNPFAPTACFPEKLEMLHHTHLKKSILENKPHEKDDVAISAVIRAEDLLRKKLKEEARARARALMMARLARAAEGLDEDETAEPNQDAEPMIPIPPPPAHAHIHINIEDVDENGNQTDEDLDQPKIASPPPTSYHITIEDVGETGNRTEQEEKEEESLNKTLILPEEEKVGVKQAAKTGFFGMLKLFAIKLMKAVIPSYFWKKNRAEMQLQQEAPPPEESRIPFPPPLPPIPMPWQRKLCPLDRYLVSRGYGRFYGVLPGYHKY